VLGLVLLASTLAAGSATASTLTQNTTWTIDRAGTTTKYRLTAYGDSLYAGYFGSIWDVIKRAAPWTDGEYASNLWNADIEVVRRAKSGARADAIYNEKIVGERAYMQTTNTRIVSFEMCGNDYLQARNAFVSQTGTCNYAPLDTALANCTYYMERAMQYINANAYSGTRLKVITNLPYNGYDGDNILTNCTDPATGQKVNRRDKFLPYVARGNYRTCNLAWIYGFKCVDSFADYMAADYDSNGDGQVDSTAIRYQAGESEPTYVNRISVTLKSTLRDPNRKFVNATTSYDYVLSDEVHPTYYGTATVRSGLLWDTGTGSGPPDFSGSQIVGGKNPVWNRLGHERMGWSLSTFTPGTP
jgi:hypothetical protein